MVKTISKPLLRWAGSKRQVIHRLIPFWNPKYQRYVEPFAGSAALFFALNPAKAVLSDLNKDLIDTYGVLKQSPELLHQRISAIPKSKGTYLKLRKVETSSLSKLERAVRFFYLNRFCFNGIYRTNSKGQFNVPYAFTGTGELPSLERFRQCAKSLANAKLRSCDFNKTLEDVQDNDFVYLDPPYAVQEKRVFCEYGPKPFGREDLVRLQNHLTRIHKRGAKFVLSYAFCKEAKEIFKKWKTSRLQVRRNIAGFADARRKSFELLVTNI